MDKPLAGKVAVVTGAGRNIGREEALALARAGARVVVNSKNSADDTVATIRQAGGEAVPVVCDAASWEAGETIVGTALEAFGQIDILVNNAGIHRPSAIESMTEEQWDEVVNVSLKCYAATIRFAAPHFIAQRSGIIVNTGSTSGLGHLGVANYSAAKEGVLGLTRTVARELGQYGIRCNMIRPISLISDLITPEVMRGVEQSRELGLPTNGTRHFTYGQETMPAAEHVAALALLLCLPETDQISGQDFFVMGDEVGRFPEPELYRSLFHPGGWTVDALKSPAVLENLLGDIRNRYIRS